MRLVILVCQLCLILRIEAQMPEVCITSDTNRPPENSDIFVTCGTEYMDLSIYLCPMYQALYNESQMVLNNQIDTPECYGTADYTVDPPVLKFRFPLNGSSISSCNNDFKITDQVGTGQFSDISKVQYVNISGTVNSLDPSAGMITYRSQILYKFSCFYPMQYLMNNTRLDVSGVNIAIQDKNGSFISTLSMELYQDEQYQQKLDVPTSGLNLKTKIYVAVKATNLTERFNVLLDRCYATPTPYPTFVISYDLFVGCERDAQTKVEINGLSQTAYFSFEAFRFVVDKNKTISTFYIHCVTRLCEVSSCSQLQPNCGSTGRRRRREAPDVLANATVTSPVIVVGKQSSVEAQTFSASYGLSSESSYSGPVVAVIVCIVVLSILLVAMTAYFVLYVRRKPLIQ
ncbi:zona pellucida-like domain-containing protein 1 [Cebidichthys violaceus]|uniref:zona pellucida-like domain-containing protein 1 n=1 Tax=Cebidichthys violaceus TaxID=271503 RepID=UPI0035CB21C6